MTINIALSHLIFRRVYTEMVELFAEAEAHDRLNPYIDAVGFVEDSVVDTVDSRYDAAVGAIMLLDQRTPDQVVADAWAHKAEMLDCLF